MGMEVDKFSYQALRFPSGSTTGPGVPRYLFQYLPPKVPG